VIECGFFTSGNIESILCLKCHTRSRGVAFEIWKWAACLIGGGVVRVTAEESEFLVWESLDGRTLEAKILGRTDEAVRMERVDGSEYTIPINRFVKADRERIQAWTPPPIEEPLQDQAVLVLETTDGRGTGFLVQDAGEIWVYTNQHVIRDGVSLKAFDTEGVAVDLGSLEIALDRDVARFTTKTRRGLFLADSVKTGNEVIVYGNSQGSGVITRSEGEVLGIAPETIEVSAEIVSGNSGGPVVDDQGMVVGISTFVQFGELSDDPTMKSTRFEKPRRFALRLDGDIDFRQVEVEKFEEVFNEFQAEIQKFDEAWSLSAVISADPYERIMSGTFDTSEVIDVAEDHNKDLERISKVIYSDMSYRSKVRRISGRLIDTLEDLLEVGEQSVESARETIADERFGWLQSELDNRKKLLPHWRESVRRVEESFD